MVAFSLTEICDLPSAILFTTAATAAAAANFHNFSNQIQKGSAEEA